MSTGDNKIMDSRISALESKGNRRLTNPVSVQSSTRTFYQSGDRRKWKGGGGDEEKRREMKSLGAESTTIPISPK